MTTTIAVIEDEVTIATAVAARLRAEGFEVELAHDGPTGVALCERVRPDVVILDLMLPGFDGLEVCRRIQGQRHVPVIMLTALDSEVDKVIGLGVGADDYVTKPFSTKELVARVKALLRRIERRAEPALRVESGELTVDPDRRLVTNGGEAVHLTPTEFDLLHLMGTRAKTVFSRDQLMSEVWGYGDVSGGRTVDSHIASLRRKLGKDVIRTVHGVGYSFEGSG
jgi:DNA-binding response OmpR family regulator